MQLDLVTLLLHTVGNVTKESIMALTPAEKQAAYRARKSAALAAEVEALRAAAKPSPFADCTPEEVEYLKRMLAAFRASSVGAVMQEANEMAKVAGESANSKAKSERDALKASLLPPDGEYWQQRMTGINPVAYDLFKYTLARVKGKPVVVDANGNRQGFTFSVKKERWEISGDSFYATPEEAERAAQLHRDELRNIVNPKPVNPLLGKPKEELRRIRSQNHPDKNASADHVLYQQAVEALDALR